MSKSYAYAFYDKSGTLKEFIIDKAVRQGNININGIYIYIDPVDALSPTSASYNWCNCNDENIEWSTPVPFNLTLQTFMIDAIKDYDPKYFKYGTPYKGYLINLSANGSTILESAGKKALSIHLYNEYSESLFDSGLIVFDVEATGAIEYATEIPYQMYYLLLDQITQSGGGGGSSENSVPYKTITATGKTVSDLYDAIGPKVQVVHFTDFSYSSYIGFVAHNTTNDTYDIEFEKFASDTPGSKERYVGSGIPATALVTNILIYTSQYFKPYALQEDAFLEVSLTGLTLAQLYAKVGYTKILKFHFYGGTGDGFYIGTVAPFIPNQYDRFVFEFEQFAGGEISKHRWVGLTAPASTLLSDILTVESPYYAPYLVNGTVLDYDTATFQQVKEAINGGETHGGVPEIIKLTGSSESAGFSNTGFYLIRISSSNDFIAIALDLQDRSLAGLVRYQGTISDTSTLIKDIFNPSSAYYHPYALKSEVSELNTALSGKQNALTAGTGIDITSDVIRTKLISYSATDKTIKDLYDDLFSVSEEVKIIDFTGPTTMKGAYIVKIHKVNAPVGGPRYTVTFEFLNEKNSSPFSGVGSYRWVGSGIQETVLVSDIITTSSQYFEPYALKSESVGYTTTAPTSNNSGPLQIVVLSSEPANKYDGYLYIITGSNS